MSQYTVIILLTLVGFLGLAALLLVPVYRFLKREEETSREWTHGGPDPPSVSANEGDRSG